MIFENGGLVVSNIFIYAGYLFFTVLFYLPPLWASSAWSGNKFSRWKLLVVSIYNIFFTYAHMKFVDQGYILFVGYVDKSILGWVSLFMILLYVSTIPDEQEQRNWFLWLRRK